MAEETLLSRLREMLDSSTQNYLKSTHDADIHAAQRDRTQAIINVINAASLSDELSDGIHDGDIHKENVAALTALDWESRHDLKSDVLRAVHVFLDRLQSPDRSKVSFDINDIVSTYISEKDEQRKLSIEKELDSLKSDGVLVKEGEKYRLSYLYSPEYLFEISRSVRVQQEVDENFPS